MQEPTFLSTEEVLRLHAISLEQNGGSSGLREPGGLESAVMQPQQDYFYAQADLYAIAASYAFHIAEWQAFVDGNKRTALAAALFFLEAHGIDTTADQDVLYDAMIAISSHALDKAGLAALFRRIFADPPTAEGHE